MAVERSADPDRTCHYHLKNQEFFYLATSAQDRISVCGFTDSFGSFAVGAIATDYAVCLVQGIEEGSLVPQ